MQGALKYFYTLLSAFQKTKNFEMVEKTYQASFGAS